MGSNPNWTYGYVPTPAQWNEQWASKQDDLGYVPVNKAGDTMAGPLVTFGSTPDAAGFAISPGVAPDTPTDGDMWATSAGLYVQINGGTVGPLGVNAGGITTDNAIARYDGTGGLLQNSVAILSDLGDLTGIRALTISGAGSFSPANANVVISPTGTGVVTIAPATAGSLNNVAIGAVTPLAGFFTTLSATGNVTLSPTGTVTINPSVASAMDNVTIGASTPKPGTFTALTATAAVGLSPVNANVVLSPTGTGVVTIAPATAGTINNMSIGASTPLAGFFTTLSATGAVTLSPTGNVTISPTGNITAAPSGTFTINPTTASNMDNVTIGASTPKPATVTALTATGAVALSPANANVVIAPTGTGTVTLNPATAGTMNNMSVGQTTPAAGTFSMLALSGSSAGAIVTGSYTPTGTATANIDSITPGVAHYIRVGNQVFVWGFGQVDPTAAANTNTTFRMTLPIASNIGANSDLSGTLTFAGAQRGGAIFGDATNDAASVQFASEVTVLSTFTYNYGYVII